MEKALARFKANNGTGVWGVFPSGVRVGGEFYRFTDTSHITCCGTQGRTERRVSQVQGEGDCTNLFQALAVYWETGDWVAAGLTAWVFDDDEPETRVEDRVIPGNVQLSIGGLSCSTNRDASLRYREDGRWVQVDAIQRFADATLAAIRAYRNRPQ